MNTEDYKDLLDTLKEFDVEIETNESNDYIEHKILVQGLKSDLEELGHVLNITYDMMIYEEEITQKSNTKFQIKFIVFEEF